MKVIVAGCRDFNDSNFVYGMIDSFCVNVEIDEIVSGCATGVDTAGECWATHHAVPIKKFPADWNKHGRAAGPIRNREMAQYADALIAIWDGKSRGTKNMIEEMKKLGKPVRVFEAARGSGT